MPEIRRLGTREFIPTPQAVPLQRYGEIRGSNLVLTRTQGEKLIFSGSIHGEITLSQEGPGYVWLMISMPGTEIRKETELPGSGKIGSRYVKVELARQIDRDEYEDKPGIIVGESFLVKLQKKSGFGGKRFFMVLPPDIFVDRPENLERRSNSPAR